jgi:cyclophilin family peptidyl-prolyl cis-trans isomerase
MPRITPREQVPTLLALDSMWQRGKHNWAFRGPLEHSQSANMYRTTLIRAAGVVMDAEVGSIALDLLRDSTIVIDSIRQQANQYVLGYLKQFGTSQFRDLLLASVNAEAWLRDNNPEVAKALYTDYAAAREWHDQEVMDSIRVALVALGQSVRNLQPIPPIHSNIDWNYIENIPTKMLVSLEHGSIMLKLHTYDAPITVANMVRLALDGYFSSQMFHRVVPNFVVQSGDPTGSGFGGPGYAIRSEISQLAYDKDGITGMASSGKDTEGSQWFITQCPTPHLDGHYTIWAEVLQGEDDMMKVKRGDKITSIYPMP